MLVKFNSKIIIKLNIIITFIKARTEIDLRENKATVY